MRKLTQSFVFVIEPQKVLLFNIVISLFGFEYVGKDDSKIYIITMVVFFLVSFTAFLLQKVGKEKLAKNYIGVFVLTCFVLINFLIFKTNFNSSYQYEKYFYFFFVFSFCSLLWGIEFGRNLDSFFENFSKSYEFIFVLISIYSCITVFFPTINDSSVLRSGSYQSNSYYSAFAFGGLLYYLLAGSDIPQYPFFTSVYGKLLLLVLIGVLPFSIIATGGRGGVVLLFFYVIIGFFYLLSKSRNSSQTFVSLLFYSLLVLFFFLVFFLLVFKSSELTEGLAVSLSYINFSEGSIDMSQTSGRDLIYRQAISLIKERPILGYGLFGYMPYLTTVYQYPHNFLLEILLQGGLVYLVVVLFFFILILNKLVKLVRSNSAYWLLAVIGIYPITMLSFSGSYLSTSMFWFVIAALLSAKVKKRVRYE